MKEITIKNGKNQGPISVIFAGVHGNEICGIRAFEKIISKLTIKNGTVYFVLGNPKAIKEGKRFTDYNLNRLFSLNKRYSSSIKKTYEYKRSLVLKKILGKADALLDIHSTTKKISPFIICEKKSQKIADFLPKDFNKIIYGFDKIEPGGTDGYMDSLGKIGICVECGVHTSNNSVSIACKAIIKFLQARGHICKKNSLNKIIRQKLKMDFTYYTKSNNFILSKKFKNFEKISKKQIIGVDGRKIIIAPNDCFILFPNNRNKKREEAFLLGHEIS